MYAASCTAEDDVVAMKIFLHPPSYIEAALRHALVEAFGTFEEVSEPGQADLQWADYEELDLQSALDNKRQWICAYSIRKALIRKHFLSQTVREYVAKNSQSILSSSVPESFHLEVDYAEFLDDALDEAFELRGELELNADRAPVERKWFILKPSMAERGAGIRLFSTIAELTNIFEDNEGQSSEEEDDDKDNDDIIVASDSELSDSVPGHSERHSGVMTSDMRFFVVQEYISRPLLLQALQNRKFHLRVYILCIGSIAVYLHRNVLVLSSAEPYSEPSFEEGELLKHLTNTCYQTGSSNSTTSETLVHPFWTLKDPAIDHNNIWAQLRAITTDLFKAAGAQRINFQTLPNAFEVFGVDFLVDEHNKAHLLEVNAYPDFGQTGEEHKDLVAAVARDMVTLVARNYRKGITTAGTQPTPEHSELTSGSAEDAELVGGFEQCLLLNLL